jgi:hypothetical protein
MTLRTRQFFLRPKKAVVWDWCEALEVKYSFPTLVTEALSICHSRNSSKIHKKGQAVTLKRASVRENRTTGRE